MISPRRCDHDKRNPRRTPLAALKSTHLLIEEARERAQQIYDRRFEPEVSEPLRRRQKGRRGGFFRAVVTVSHLKSQRAEADTVLLVRLLDGCNVRTNECGRWDKERGAFERWSVDDLVKHTGLSQDRVERALSDMCAGGRGEQLLFRLQQKVERFDPKTRQRKWEGLVAITKVTDALWELLGLAGRRKVLLAREDEAKEKAERKAEIKAERAAEEPPPPAFKAPPGYYALCWELEAEGMSRQEAHETALARLAPKPPPE